MNLTLRVLGSNPKVAPLTHAEVDTNFLEVSASLANIADSAVVTASLSSDVLRFEKGDGSTFDIDFRDFVIEPETGSLYLSSSIDLVAQSISFRKGNGSDDIINLSSFVTETESGSLIYSASLDLNSNLFTFHRDHGNYTIDISNLTGVTLINTIATGSISGSFKGEATGSFTGSFGGVLTGQGSGSFSGSFEGEGSGIRGVVLDHNIHEGDGILPFHFDGNSDAIVNLDTGSNYFTEGVREKLSATPTTGPSGVNLSYNQSNGDFSAELVNSVITLGNSSVDLGDSLQTIDGVQLTDVNATGSFTGSFEGDFILSKDVSNGSGIEAFSFNGETDQIVTLDTGSTHFTEGVRSKINVTDTFGANGVDLTYDEATGNLQATIVNSAVSLGNSTVALGDTLSAVDGLQLTDVDATGSFSGSFEGDFILSKNVSNGAGIEAFSFDGQADQIVTLNTGSTHFTEGVREKINVTDTTGASGVDLTYDEATGNIQATLVNSDVTFGNTTVDLGGSSNVIDGLQLTNVDATGSFSGSFTGDFILSKNVSSGLGLETFSFDGQTNQAVNLDTGSLHFTEGVKKKLNTDGIYSASVQINHDATTNFVANEHIDHTGVNITAGLGMLGGGNISVSRTLTLDTGSTHFNSGVKAKLNTEQVISGSVSGQVDHDLTINFVANEHIDHSTVSVSPGLGLSGGGDITATRTLTLDTGSTHFTGGIKTKLNAEAVVSSSAQVKSLLPSGTVSGSSQITITESQISDLDHYTDSDTLAYINSIQVLSGSLTSILPTGVVSGSAQVKNLLPTGTVSGSSQITITESQISDLVHYTDSDTKAKMNLDNVVSGSLTTLLPTGVVSGSAQVKQLLPSGTVSGSSISSTSQGTIDYLVNGVTTTVDLGVQTSDAVQFGSVVVNGTLDSTAVLQADSTTKGFLPPRMTEVQRGTITNPATGLIVYQTDGTITVESPFGNIVVSTAGIWYYNGTSWEGPLTA